MSKTIFTSYCYEVFMSSEHHIDVYKDADRRYEILTFSKQDLIDMLKFIEENEK